jgi:CRP/FNR family cyclic AMP-dependent transcriptional regulator
MSSFTENAPEENKSEVQLNLERLRELQYFERIPLELLKVVAYLCKRVKYKPGTILFEQDEPCANAFLILSGQAEVVRKGEDGELTLGEIEEGSFVGGLSLVADVKRLFSLKAKTPCLCLVLDRGDFWPAINQNPEAAKMFMEALAQRIVAWEERFIESGACQAQLGLVDVGVSLI